MTCSEKDNNHCQPDTNNPMKLEYNFGIVYQYIIPSLTSISNNYCIQRDDCSSRFQITHITSNVQHMSFKRKPLNHISVTKMASYINLIKY